MREAQAEIRSTMSVNTLESGSKLDSDKNDADKNSKRSSNSNSRSSLPMSVNYLLMDGSLNHRFIHYPNDFESNFNTILVL